MAKPIDQILSRDMSRRKFLLSLGFGLVSVFGFGRIIELLTGQSPHKNIAGHSSTQFVYSGGDYSGTSNPKLAARKST